MKRWSEQSDRWALGLQSGRAWLFLTRARFPQSVKNIRLPWGTVEERKKKCSGSLSRGLWDIVVTSRGTAAAATAVSSKPSISIMRTTSQIHTAR